MLVNQKTDARPGRHRSNVRRHRPAHQSNNVSLLARLLPSWTIRASATRPAVHARPQNRRPLDDLTRLSSSLVQTLAGPDDITEPPDTVIDLRDEAISEEVFDEPMAPIEAEPDVDLDLPEVVPTPADVDAADSLDAALHEIALLETVLHEPVDSPPVETDPVVDTGPVDAGPVDAAPMDTVPSIIETEPVHPESDAALPEPVDPIPPPTASTVVLTPEPVAPEAAPTRPARRRLTFAELLGFGVDTREELYTPNGYEPAYEPQVGVAIDELPYEPNGHALATAPPPLVEPPVEPAVEPIEEPAVEAAPDHGWDDLPSLADVATEEQTNTGMLVQRLWDATAEHSAVDDADQLAPLDLPQIFRSHRTFRWGIVGGAVLFLLLVLVGLRAVGQHPVKIAEERAVQYEQAANSLGAALVGFDATARSIASPSTPTDDLGALTGELLGVGTFGRELAELTATPLPEPSLLGASGPIDRLQQPQELLRQASERALTIERRLGDTLTYRVSMHQAFDMPDLPVALAESALGDLGADLSVIQVTTEQLLAQLPDDPFFATYTERAHRLLDQYEDWQVEYMAALRDGDVAQAGVLRRDWELELQEFDAAIGSPLMAVDTWSAEQLVHLRTLLDEALELLG